MKLSLITLIKNNYVANRKAQITRKLLISVVFVKENFLPYDMGRWSRGVTGT